MKGRLCVLAVLSLAAALGAPALSDQSTPRSRVGYVPFVNAAGEMRYDIVSGTATDTLELELGLVPYFEVERVSGFDPYARPEMLREHARKRSLDYIVFGKAGPGGAGQIVLQISVFDSKRGGVAVTREETAAGMLNVFGAAERLVVNAVRDFSGVRIGFGALEVVNTGEEGDYEVYADGIPLGRNFRSSRKVFNGSRLLEITQNRLLGRETIYSGRVSVEEGREARVEFAVPYLTEREKARIRTLEGEIDALEGDRRAEERVRGVFAELLGLFRDVSCCRRLAEERERLRQREVEYSLGTITWEIEDTFFKPEERTFASIKSIYDGRGAYLDPATVEAMASDAAQYMFEVLQLHALYELSQGNWDRGVAYYRFMERIRESMPLTNTGTFEEDRRFVFRVWKKYAKRSAKREVFPEVMIGVKVGRHFGGRLQTAERFFKEPEKGGEKELVILTSPYGMTVAVDGKGRGPSPLRVRGVRNREADVSAVEAAGPMVSKTVVLEGQRTFVFLRADSGGRIAVNRAEKQGKGALRLSWSPVPGAAYYRVQVDAADGDFLKPVADMKRVAKPYAVLAKRLKRGTLYVYRVQAVRKKGGAGHWGYSEPFSVE